MEDRQLVQITIFWAAKTQNYKLNEVQQLRAGLVSSLRTYSSSRIKEKEEFQTNLHEVLAYLFYISLHTISLDSYLNDIKNN